MGNFEVAITGGFWVAAGEKTVVRPLLSLICKSIPFRVPMRGPTRWPDNAPRTLPEPEGVNQSHPL